MLSNPTAWMGKRFGSIDWAFIRGSALISVGMLLARILGLAFSLILARTFAPDEFGYIQYIFAVAGVVAIVIHPFGQHVIARFISAQPLSPAPDRMQEQQPLPQSGEEQQGNATMRQTGLGGDGLANTLANCWWLFAAILGLTLAITLMLVVYSANLGWELIAAVIGIAIFYAYWGVSRGYMRSELLTAAYLGSNVVQLIVVVFVIWLLGVQSTALAVSIYGLSYVPVLLWLQRKWPLQLHMNWQRQALDRARLSQLIRFAIPVVFSHAAYMLFAAVDMIFLNQSVNPDNVGQYALAKTLSTAFAFIPMGIATLLMPRIAGSDSSNSRGLLLGSVSASLAINVLFLIGFWFCVEWFVSTFFGIDYLTSMTLYLMLALNAVMLGIQSIVASVYVGKDQPQVETYARGLAVVVLLIGCWIFIPKFGEVGAAASVLAGSTLAVLFYIWHGTIYSRGAVE